jgi:hypothetical protein
MGTNGAVAYVARLAAAAAADPAGAALGALLLGLLLRALAAAVRSRRSGPTRGFGSGENNLWNRRIRTERPVHASKHHKLEHTW